MQVVLLLLRCCSAGDDSGKGLASGATAMGRAFSLSLLSSSTPCDAACVRAQPPPHPRTPGPPPRLGLLAASASPPPRASPAASQPLAGRPLAPLNHNNLFCDLTKEVILIRGRRHDLGLRPHITLITCFVENEESYPYPYFLRREVWQCLPDKSMPKHYDLYILAS